MQKNIRKLSLAVVFMFMALSMQVSVHGAGTTPISTPLNTLLTIVTDLVTGIGSIITLYGIFEFGNAQQTQDGAAKSFAIQRISGGLIMASVSHPRSEISVPWQYKDQSVQIQIHVRTFPVQYAYPSGYPVLF